jgi:hypothetical protein
LHIKEATSKSRTADEGDEPVWQEFKLGDTNLFTMEQRQQVSFMLQMSAQSHGVENLFVIRL